MHLLALSKPWYFEGVCVNYRHPAPRRGEPRVGSARFGSICNGSSGLAGSAGEFLTPNSAADVYQKIDLGASWRALPEGVAPKELKGRPKDVQDKNLSKYIKIYTKYIPNISKYFRNSHKYR